MAKLLVIIIVFTFSACSSKKAEVPPRFKEIEHLKAYSTDAEPDSNIKFINETILEAPDSISINWWGQNSVYPNIHWLAGIETDDSGEIYIGDSNNIGIHVFDNDGHYLSTLGREGYGSGEYSGIYPIRIASDSLFVYDGQQQKLVMYPIDSLQNYVEKSVRTVPENLDANEEVAGWFAGPIYLMGDGSLLVGFYEHLKNLNKGSPNYNVDQRRPVKYYFMDQERMIISDEIFELDDYEDIFTEKGGTLRSNLGPYPFLGQTLIAISGNDYIYTNWTDDFLIRVYDSNGQYHHAIYYPFQNKPLKREQLFSLFSEDNEPTWELVQYANLPETWPAIQSMIADDKNRLWISTKIEKDGVYEWWVLHQEGELIARFQWPDDLSIETVKNGHAYVLESDKETQLDMLKRYRIRME